MDRNPFFPSSQPSCFPSPFSTPQPPAPNNFCPFPPSPAPNFSPFPPSQPSSFPSPTTTPSLPNPQPPPPSSIRQVETTLTIPSIVPPGWDEMTIDDNGTKSFKTCYGVPGLASCDTLTRNDQTDQLEYTSSSMIVGPIEHVQNHTPKK